MDQEYFETGKQTLEPGQGKPISFFYSPGIKASKMTGKMTGYRRQVTLDFPANRLQKPSKQGITSITEEVFADQTFCQEHANCLEEASESSEEKPAKNHEVKDREGEENWSEDNNVLDLQSNQKNQKLKLSFPSFKLKLDQPTVESNQAKKLEAQLNKAGSTEEVCDISGDSEDEQSPQKIGMRNFKSKTGLMQKLNRTRK